MTDLQPRSGTIVERVTPDSPVAEAAARPAVPARRWAGASSAGR